MIPTESNDIRWLRDGNGEMFMSRQSSDAGEAKRETAALAEQYRAIGPAALVAALICVAKKQDAPVQEKKAA